ncbi:MAG: hypothetical protein GY801_15660 [bacterium]|nr:hypothetical protein [bacterium]
MKLTNIAVSFLLMVAADFLLLRRSYEAVPYYGQYFVKGDYGGFPRAARQNPPGLLYKMGGRVNDYLMT